MTLAIRRAAPGDAALLARLNGPVQALHARARPDLFKPPQAGAALARHYADLLDKPDCHIYIGEAGGQPVAHAVAFVIHRPDNPFTYAFDVLQVDELSVIEEARGRGYGRALMEAMFALVRALQIRTVRLDVWTFNQDALAFYERLGFRAYNARLERTLPEP